MKRIAYLLLLALLASTTYAQQAKYVFYFIGDGMGVNQVNGTEMYQAELQGRIGTEPLLFASFPVVGTATTYSASNSITDSAAAGTALSTGTKTYNGAIGVDTARNVLQTVAEKARQDGKRVGIATSVSIDHATPAAFYAHQIDRDMYYEIALDIPRAGFDFYAGGGFLRPHTNAEGQEVTSIFPQLESAGYTVARGMDDYRTKAPQADKLILIQPEGTDPASLPYAIDRQPGDMTLADITRSAIDFLTKSKDKGFFLMVEGGKIDWACHGNDAATAFNEVKDMDEAVKVAYKFYKKHPKETLIVITADHETGGMGLGSKGYKLYLKRLALQQQSQEELSVRIAELRRDKENNVSWEDAKQLLTETMGFWKEIPLTWEQERTLHDVYEASFVTHKAKYEETLYAKNEPLAAAARRLMSQLALVGWATGDHSAGLVPVYAIGAGAKLFDGKMDNTDIPKFITRAAGY